MHYIVHAALHRYCCPRFRFLHLWCLWIVVYWHGIVSGWRDSLPSCAGCLLASGTRLPLPHAAALSWSSARRIVVLFRSTISMSSVLSIGSLPWALGPGVKPSFASILSLNLYASCNIFSSFSVMCLLLSVLCNWIFDLPYRSCSTWCGQYSFLACTLRLHGGMMALCVGIGSIVHLYHLFRAFCCCASCFFCIGL